VLKLLFRDRLLNLVHIILCVSVQDCIESLESVMTAHIPNVIAVDGKHSVWKGLFPWTESYFSKVYEAMTNTSDVSLKTVI
jgi:hypothetical protein